MGETIRAAVLTHVAIRTRCMDESLDFYRRYAGLEIVHKRVDEGVRVVWLSQSADDPDFVIVLLELPHELAPEPQACDHLGFDVESRQAVDRIAERARAEGCLRHGPADGGPIVGYFCMLRDPSGNSCEFSHGQPIHPRQIG
ncbi:MAG: VOC family protein [Proteobacteria bacterium]|nr:VOC family protein [Pseudomonadota bacterium]